MAVVRESPCKDLQTESEVSALLQEKRVSLSLECNAAIYRSELHPRFQQCLSRHQFPKHWCKINQFRASDCPPRSPATHLATITTTVSKKTKATRNNPLKGLQTRLTQKQWIRMDKSKQNPAFGLSLIHLFSFQYFFICIHVSYKGSEIKKLPVVWDNHLVNHTVFNIQTLILTRFF